MTTVEQDIIKKTKNQILALMVTALATGVGMNILFISSINARIEAKEKVDERRFDKVDSDIKVINSNILRLYQKQ